MRPKWLKQTPSLNVSEDQILHSSKDRHYQIVKITSMHPNVQPSYWYIKCQELNCFGTTLGELIPAWVFGDAIPQLVAVGFVTSCHRHHALSCGRVLLSFSPSVRNNSFLSTRLQQIRDKQRPQRLWDKLRKVWPWGGKEALQGGIEHKGLGDLRVRLKGLSHQFEMG